MVANSDGLVDQLLLKIALAGIEGKSDAHTILVHYCGFTCSAIIIYYHWRSAHTRLDERQANLKFGAGLKAVDFIRAVHDIHATKTGQQLENIEDDDDDVFLSAQPPSQAVEINLQYLETIWSWTTSHADVSVKDIDSADSEVNDAIPEGDSSEAKDAAPVPSDQAGFLAAHAGSRLCTTEERIWYALTDHGVDWKRLPRSEFVCLSIVAAHGPAGILQPDLVRLSGQDKRSVPRRTDTLHSKGYLVKESCLGGGIKTSLLRLKKLVKSDEKKTAHFGMSTNAGDGTSVKMIRYDQWFDQLVSLLKENKGLMTFDELRVRMGVQSNTLQTRSLHRCVRRLVASGLLRKLKARQKDAEGLEPDETSPKKMKKKKIKKNEDLWLRCVMLLRDPLDSDRQAFEKGAPPSTDYTPMINAPHDQVSWNHNGEDLTLVDAEDGDSDAEMVDPITLDVGNKNVNSGRTNLPSQWFAGTHYTNRFFDIIESRGPQGISSMDLGDLGLSRVFKRPFDEAISKMTDVWHTSQPPHLRHLAIIRDTSIQGTSFHFLFRTFDNFQRAVDAGKASWEYVLDSEEKSAAANQPSDLDEWGFPRIPDEQLVDETGTASVTECAMSEPLTYGPKHSNSSSAKKQPKGKWKKLVKPKQGNARSPSVKEPLSRPKKVRKNSILQPDDGSSSAKQTPSKLSQEVPLSGATPLPATPRDFTPEADTPSHPRNISEKRQEKELTEWKTRIRRRAEFAIRQQIKHERETAAALAASLANSTPDDEPPKKRKRGRPTKAETAEAKLAVEAKVVSEAEVEAEKAAAEAKAIADAEEARLAAEAKAAAEAEMALSKQIIAAAGGSTTDGGDSQSVDADASAKEKKKRKRNSDSEEPEDPEELPEDRVDAVQAEIESMSTPGVYINPPGSGLMKLMNYFSRGRPRTSLIAVFKTPKLSSLEWFIPEKSTNKRHDNVRSERRPSGARSVELDTEVSNQVEDRFTRYDGPEDTVMQVSPSRAAQKPADAGQSMDLHGATQSHDESDIALIAQMFDNPQGSTALETLQQARVHRPSSATKTLDQEAEPILGVAHLDNPLSSGMDTGITAPEYGVRHGAPEPDDQIDLDTHSRKLEKSAQDQSLESQGALNQEAQGDVDMQGATATVQSALDARLEREKRTPKARASQQNMVRQPQPDRKPPSYVKRDGVHTNGGIIKHQRSKIVLDIVRQCGGVFPGDREMFFPFVTVWLRLFGQQPDRQTIDRIVRNLLASGKLISKTFAFMSKQGLAVKKRIIMEPGIHMNDPAVLKLEKNIEAAHPAPYVPEQAPLHPDMRTQIANHPANILREHNKRAEEFKQRRALLANYHDRFPEDITQTVRAPEPVSLGITDQVLQQSIARRQKKAEQDAKQADRLMRKVRGEPVELDADLEVESSLGPKSSARDPNQAHVDGGPKGRARLAKVTLLQKSKKPVGTPLGSLQSIRQKQASRVRSIQKSGNSRGGWSSVSDVELTLTTPTQTYCGTSGTFSTDASISIALPRSLQEILGRVHLPKDLNPQYTDTASNGFEREVQLVQQWELQETRLNHYYGHAHSRPYDFINHVGPKRPKHIAHLLLDWSRVDVDYTNAPIEHWFNGTAHTDPATRSISGLQGRGESSFLVDHDMAAVASQMRPGHGSYGVMTLGPMQTTAQNVTISSTAANRSVWDSQPYAHSLMPTHAAWNYGPHVHNLTSASVYAPTSSHSMLNNLEGMIVPWNMTHEEAYREAQDLPDEVRNKVQKGPFQQPKQPKQPKQARAPPRQPLPPKPKPEPKRQVLPPSFTNKEVFNFSKEEDKRLVLAIAVVKTLAGGLEQSNRAINWGLVHQVFKYKFDAKYCRNRWDTLKFKNTPTMERLQQQVRRLVLCAYGQQDFPSLDLAYPEKVDWTELVRWTEANLEPDEAGLPDELPETRHDFDEDFELRFPDEVYQPDMEDFYAGTQMQLRREEMVRDMSFVMAVKQTTKLDLTMFLKSWVRSEALTHYAGLDDVATATYFDDFMSLKPRVIEELTVEKFFRRETALGHNGARINIPSEFLLGSLNRTYSIARFREAATVKEQIDAAFKNVGKYTIDYLASDAANMAIQNLASEDRAVIEPVLPELNHDFDAPFPKLSKWGFTDSNYKTVHMDKERLQFALELVPTQTYLYGNPLRSVEIPLTRQYEGEPGPRLPFWTTLSGKLIRENWDNLLASILSLLATRSGMKSDGLSRTHKGKIWTWEIEMMLEWAEKAGLAQRMGGEDGGWTTGEWWWMVMAPRDGE